MFEPPGRKTPEEKLTANVVKAMKATKRGTLARRYVRSLLCAEMSRGEVNTLLGSSERTERRGESDDDEEGGETGDGALRITGKTFSRARRDWETLLECGELSASKFGRSKVQDDSLRSMLAFLFSPENVVLSSWGGANVVVEGKVLQLPAVMAAKNGSILHQEYVKALESRGETPLSRGSFYAVLNTLTRRDVSRVLPVDNATRTLVKDPLTMVRDLVIRMASYGDRAPFLKEVDKVEWVLSWSFADSHLGSDSLGSHDINFILKNSALEANTRAITNRPIECKGCSFPFSLLSEVEKLADLKDREAVAAFVEMCRRKFVDYMQYHTWKYAQAKALDITTNEILSKSIRNRVIVFMDYIHSDCVERMGKTNIFPPFSNTGFHGSVVYYLGRDEESQPAKNVLKSLSYLHLINIAANTDPSAVAFATEALLGRIRIDLPLVNEIVFVTDNAAAYKNHFVPRFLPHLTRNVGLRTVRMLHTCSQICEFLVEAVFESVTNRMREICEDFKTTTPSDMVRLVSEDSESLHMSAEQLETLEAGSFIERVNDFNTDDTPYLDFRESNDIVYQEWHSMGTDIEKESRTVKARVFDFAGIGNGTAVEIDDVAFCSLSQSESAIIPQPSVVDADSTPKPTSNGSQDAAALGFSVRSTADGQNGFGTATDQPIPDLTSAAQLSFVPQAAAIDLGEAGYSRRGLVTGVRVMNVGVDHSKPASGIYPRPGKVSRGLIADTISYIKTTGSTRGKKDKLETGVKEEVVGSTAGRTGIVGRSCQDCNRCFKSERFLNAHLCKGRPADKDISAKAIVLADEMFREGKLPAFANCSEHLWKDSILTESIGERYISHVGYGWALKKPSYKIEDNCMQEYKRQVFAMLDESRGGEPVPATALQARLLTTYQGRDDVPDLSVISHWRELRMAAWRIQPFCQIGTDGTPVLTYEEENENGQGKSRMKNRYTAKITEMHQKQLLLAESARSKPRHMFKEFENFFKDEQGRTPPDFPEMKQVMNKINALRSKSKRAEVR